MNNYTLAEFQPLDENKKPLEFGGYMDNCTLVESLPVN
jgi:hypothetical protein